MPTFYAAILATAIIHNFNKKVQKALFQAVLEIFLIFFLDHPEPRKLI
jgi:hypothetical protein